MTDREKELISIIESTMDKDTLRYMQDSLMTDSDTDRGIYETWGGRAIDTYETVKKIYKILMYE